MVKFSVALCTAVVGAALSAGATSMDFSVIDADAIGVNVVPVHPYHGIFDLTEAGYVPGSSTIGSGGFSFSFESDGKGFKKIEVGLEFGGDDLGTSIFNNQAVYEWTGSHTFSSQPVGGLIYYTITDLQPDRSFHNFKISGATLTAHGDQPSIMTNSQVPDGGATMMLLGLGLTALAPLCRKINL
jgi:hypothetical protein